MSEHLIRPNGPLQEGDQAIMDALSEMPTSSDPIIIQGSNEAVIVDYVGKRESTPGLLKDHWSVTTIEIDDSGNPISAEPTIITVSSKDIDVVLRGGNIKDVELRTEEDKPKAADRAKLHDRETEQSIKLLTAERLKKAAATIIRL